MIVDSIKNIEKYDGVNIKASEILKFVKKAEEANLKDGRYEILGEDLFAMIQTYETKPEGECRFETHNKYIDVQYIREGKEVMDYKLREKLTVTEDLSETKDVIFYEDAEDYTRTVIEAGSFALFLPHDGHKPGIECGKIDTVKKIVFKIKTA
ncbi:YhcH/YjgK/YiaL family protein [Clostridium culturomicium]|uniref:YhcH/YjgK/YiaL family protein n=1 Tax=Clostridium culturomicium TaxID=1499683 RepID=UPI00385752B1